MNAVDQAFAALRESGRKAFIPFITAGDPDLDFTLAAIEALAAGGATLCELGIPYSDPIADGPVVQASYTRALQRGIGVRQIFDALRSVRGRLPMPVVLMVSYAIIHRMGPETFLEQASEAGVQGLIVPDLLVEESEALRGLCHQAGLGLTHLVTPTTPRDRAVQIARASSGFLYYVSVAGITGERRELPARLVEDVAWLRGQAGLPVCVGFGVSQPSQAAQLARVADGVIVGSALVRRIAEGVDGRPRRERLDELTAFAQAMVEAMVPAAGRSV